MGSSHGGWAPYIIEDAQNRGIMIDVLTAIAAKAGYKVRMVIYPEKRLQLNVKEGSIDAYPKAMEWVDNPSDYRWTDPIVQISDVVIIRKVNERSSIPGTLLGMNVGVIFGYTYPKLEEYFADGSIRRHNAKTTKNLLGMLDHDRVDAIVANARVADWVFRSTPSLHRDQFLYSRKPLDQAPYRIAFTKRWNTQPFIAFFNQELKLMKEDGRFQAILNKYR